MNKSCYNIVLFNLTDKDLEEDKEKINEEWNITPRKLMQWFGTDIFQNELKKILPDVDNKFWCLKFLKEIEKSLIIEALRKTGGVQVRATELLGINQRSLWHRIKKHNIDVRGIKNNDI